MTIEREKELESAMYKNCLLLGLDPSIIGSNRVVEKIISELEAQGSLPKSHSRLSSLATCYGLRFVELLWQLSLHALREVHRRTYAADVVSNPLPGSLTDVAFSHAATLVPVTKARIALERRRFLKNAETAVQIQAMWSNLAHEMTAEYRGLCAEEAYLQQELEKLHDPRNKVKIEGEPWDEQDEFSSGSSQNSHLVPRATRLWDSLLSRTSQHEVLASGPIEDLIAHREHRSQAIVNRENVNESLSTSQNDEKSSWIDDRSGRGQPTVDIAEVLRRWTHALQLIHKQLLNLAKANDGEGPDLLRSANDGGTSGHAESLAATLAEHRQHLARIQVLVNHLKGVAPAIQNSISELSEDVNSISTNLPQVTNYHGRSTSPEQPQSGNFYKKQAQVNNNQMDNVSENLLHKQAVPNTHTVTSQTGYTWFCSSYACFFIEA
uniref:Augmin subunit 6 n=1 Tax=Tanacetum cinerariifolium TaxID=118510 RepID=A0A699H4Q1_TANCI|nr:augmin subunit 6 [Tanacetum cinerariifolium]